MARLGGDEFVVLLDNFEDLTDVQEVASRIINSISEPFLLDGREMYSGASIGIANLESYYRSADEVREGGDDQGPGSPSLLFRRPARARTDSATTGVSKARRCHDGCREEKDEPGKAVTPAHREEDSLGGPGNLEKNWRLGPFLNLFEPFL